MKKSSKIIDKWKAKRWYAVLAPAMFEEKEVCEIVAEEEKSLINRIVKVSLMDLIGTRSQNAMFTTLELRITEVKGDKAYTQLIGHNVSSSYIRTFARRGKSLIHESIDVKTKDEQELKVKVIAVTGAKVSNNTKTNIRKIIIEELKKSSGELAFDELIQDILYGRTVSKIFNRLKTITYMKRVEIRKTEKKEVFK